VTRKSVTGLYGKLPAHADFVARQLPPRFIAPWHAWLCEGLATAEAELGKGWGVAWAMTPVWRFALPALACGPWPISGVLMPSVDALGRRFPLTLAAPVTRPREAWFASLEAAARQALQGHLQADALQALLPEPSGGGAGASGWWSGEAEWPLSDLPPAAAFTRLLQQGPA
jgi:type VI secretion system protein ImpM